MDFPVLLTPEQAAAEINRPAAEHGLKPTITVSEIRKAIRSGELAHVELARGKWAVSPQHVTEWIAGRTRPAKAGRGLRPERQPIGSTDRSRNTSRNSP